jgi:hypothetical protein
MSTGSKRVIVFAMLSLLIAYETLRGLVPAVSRVDTDFPNYLTAAKIVADGRNPERLYDGAWFGEQARAYGMDGRSTFTPFPPPTALLLTPLAHLQPLTALRVMTAINVLCLAIAAVLLAGALGSGVAEAGVFILLSGVAIVSCLRFGQVYIVISTVCILGYYAYLRRKPWLAGICFGLFAPIKYYPLIYPAYLASRKEWKVPAAAAVTMLTVVVASLAILGWKIHETFLLSVLGGHLSAHIGQQDPFAAAFQSFDTLFRRLFILDPVLNPHPFWPAPLAQVVGTALAKIAILLAAAVALIQLGRAGKDTAVAPSIGIIGLTVMLVAPATATYHCILLWLPVALLVDHFIRQGARLTAYFLLGAYALIGFFPYKFTYPFEGHGGLTVLAYPRLFLFAAMFVACIHATFARAAVPRRQVNIA